MHIEFYELFMLSHSMVMVGGVWIPTRISQSMFCKLKPRWVKKEKDRNICCCRYHVELVNCKNTLNTLRKEHHGHGTRTRSCACLDVNCLPCRGGGSSETHGAQGVTEAAVEAEEMNYAASNNLVQRLRDLVSSFVCPAIHVAAEGSETEYWFKKACINLQCTQCGTRKFESALCGVYEVANPVNSDTIKWERYEYVGQGLKDEHGREKRRLELVLVETPVSEFIQFMKSKLAHFVKHDFIQKWQAKQYRQCIKTFPIGTVVSVIDYAENYTFLPRNEIQSKYWTSKQVMILVHIFYYHSQFSTADDWDVRKVVHFFISDDRKHDSQHAFGLLHNWCEEKAIMFEHHWDLRNPSWVVKAKASTSLEGFRKSSIASVA
ncbi:hypothetical protein R1sor_014670 [Riccia sorocarpa]|uniref:Uncharacterized protein n=1 Tax=Riccia sorocarpa TaxID=122646 RepID=A0ABD3HEA6_9MARC